MAILDDIKVRLVEPEDAEFIFNLRNGAKQKMALSKNTGGIQAQGEYIREYKFRESKGLEFYFIYLLNDKPYAVNRIYDIHLMHGTSGSWAAVDNIDYRATLYSYLYMRNYFFNKLGLNLDVMDTRINNKKVIKLHLMSGAEEIGRDEQNVYHILKKDRWLSCVEKLNKLLK